MRPFKVNVERVKALTQQELDINKKVSDALMDYVIKQAHLGMSATFFCALIIFIGLYTPNENLKLFVWFGIFSGITLCRELLAFAYGEYKRKVSVPWKQLYILGAVLGGCSWGVTGIIFLPYVSPMQQTILVLMLAGISAGAVPLSASIPEAGISFLICLVLPFIIGIAFFKHRVYFLFDVALSLYLFYMIALTIKAYQLIKNSITLQFENDLLVMHLENSNKKLEQAATHDALTQLANRRLFIANLAHAIKHASETKTPFALLYLDLDHFKEANDKHGHQIGDHILLTVTERLKDYFRKSDIIARLGGDELAIIIQHVDSKSDLEHMAQKICEIVARPIQLGNIRVQVTTSIGIAIYPCKGINEDILIKAADEAMYQAKRKGGNTFKFSPQTAGIIA